MVGLAWPGRGQGCVTNLDQEPPGASSQGPISQPGGPGQYWDARPHSPVSGPGSHRPQETPVPSESEPGPEEPGHTETRNRRREGDPQ